MSAFTLRRAVAPCEDGFSVRRLALGALGMSAHQLARAKFQGRITLDGAPVRTDARARAGQTLEIFAPDKPDLFVPSAPPPPAPGGLIVYRDEDVLVIDKPAPLATVRAARRDGQSLQDMMAGEGVFRPVSRLDKGTSGLLVAARHAHAQAVLSRALHTDGYRRAYVAVLQGRLPDACGVCALPIYSDGTPRRTVDTARGKPSLTRYRVLDARGAFTLAALTLLTGRTHQIRVHMAALGCPVAGDALYGQALEALPGRFALHAARVDFTQPVTGARLGFFSPCPENWQAIFGLNFSLLRCLSDGQDGVY